MTDRTLKLVVGHVPRIEPDAVRSAGLDACLAIVLDTYRAGATDLVIDAPLWLACLRGVPAAVDADTSVVHGEAPARWLERLRRRRPLPALGSLEAYGDALASAGDPDGVAQWDTVTWFRGSAVKAVALREPWFRVGGPAPYHDSDTTSLHVASSALEAVLQAVRTGAEREGGQLTAVVDRRSAMRPARG